jgi:predicted  nucleic acid-binding Zn-ribbon protein
VADEVRVARDQVTALETDLAEAGRAVEEADAQVETLQDDLAASRQAATSAEVALAAVRAETERGAAAAADPTLN